MPLFRKLYHYAEFVKENVYGFSLNAFSISGLIRSTSILLEPCDTIGFITTVAWFEAVLGITLPGAPIYSLGCPSFDGDILRFAVNKGKAPDVL
jgi:hypothetical protein